MRLTVCEKVKFKSFGSSNLQPVTVGKVGKDSASALTPARACIGKVGKDSVSALSQYSQAKRKHKTELFTVIIE